MLSIKKRNDLREDIKQNKVTLSKLISHQHQQILEYRMGINDGIIRTLEETGKKFGVTRERIRQIEARALNTIEQYSLRQAINTLI